MGGGTGDKLRLHLVSPILGKLLRNGIRNRAPHGVLRERLAHEGTPDGLKKRFQDAVQEVSVSSRHFPRRNLARLSKGIKSFEARLHRMGSGECGASGSAGSKPNRASHQGQPARRWSQKKAGRHFAGKSPRVPLSQFRGSKHPLTSGFRGSAEVAPGNSSSGRTGAIVIPSLRGISRKKQ